MVKKLITGLFVLSTIITVGCQQEITPVDSLSNQNNLPQVSQVNDSDEMSSILAADTACKTVKPAKNSSFKPKNNFKAKADWYETLSPELQAYYAKAKGKTGEALLVALNEIISSNARAFDYKEAKGFMYSTVDNVNNGGKTGLFDAYSDIFVPGSGSNGNSYTESGDPNQDGFANDFINCEHTWPQSFFNKSLPMVSDLHHLQSTMSVPNNRRGHFPFGMVNKDVVYTTKGGSKLGATDLTSKKRKACDVQEILNKLGTQDGHKEASQILDNEFEAIFEPWDKQKGNTARCMLYFFTRYYPMGDKIHQGEYDEQKFWDSKVSTFINWSSSFDAPDEQEKIRNEFVFKKQGNRNPFIDVPEFANLIGEGVFKAK